MNIHLTLDMKQGMIKVGLMDMKWGAIPVIKYKLYTFSGAVYVVPIDKYEYVDDIAESYFTDYCARVVVPPSLCMSLIAL